MREEIFTRLLADNNVRKAETLVIGGVGEPTAHPAFIDFTERLVHDNMELTSNAYNWDNETLAAIVKHYKRVTVSVDGLPETFKEIRGFDFTVMAENVQRLVKAKKEAGIKTPLIIAMLVLSEDNINKVRDLSPILKKTGFARFIVSNLLPQTEEDKNKITYTPYLDEKKRRFVHAWYPVASANGIPMKTPMTKINSEHRCAFVENEAIFITADGNIAPCYRIAHDGQEFGFGRKKRVQAAYFGNILEKSLNDIWYQDDYLDFRFRNFASRYPSCIDCDYVECCEYITSSEADCRANEPSCADCLWCRELIECP